MRSYPRLTNLLILAALLGIHWFVDHGRPFSYWTRFADLMVFCALAVWLAAFLRGWRRNAAIVAASILLSLAGIEACARIALAMGPTHVHTPGHQVADPVLGWRAGHAGVFHHKKLAAETGAVVFDVDYTIDEHRDRRVISAPEGAAVAFFGDSYTFGEGLPDGDTLPQVFADITGRSWRVLNFGVSGYGPQQFLRPLETGLFDDLLTDARVFVFQTAPWHAERTACIPDFMMSAPRYELIDGRPQYQGICGDSWRHFIGRLFTMSMYSAFVQHALTGATPARIDLYVAVVTRAGQIAREKYHAPTVILYLSDDGYLRGAGSSDEQIMQGLRDGGLTVIDGGLDEKDFPGQPLAIPGDGHPTAVANRARAELVRAAIAKIDPRPR